MDANFPKRTKAYKLGDRVICTNEAKEGMYMVRGWVRFLKDAKVTKSNTVGVEFEKLVRSKEDVRAYFTCKPMFGAFLDFNDLAKINEEKFDENAFKAYIKQNPDVGDKMKSKREVIVDLGESQGDFGEESQMDDSMMNGSNGFDKSLTLQQIPSTDKIPPTIQSTVISTPRETVPETKKKVDFKAEAKPEPKLVTQKTLKGNPSTVRLDDKKPDSKTPTNETSTTSSKQADPPAPKSTPNELIATKQTNGEIKAPVTAKPTSTESKSPTPARNEKVDSGETFIEIQKLNLQIVNLQNEKHTLQKQLEKAENEVSVLNNKYEGLKKMSDHSSADQIKLSEANAEMQTTIDKLKSEKEALEEQLNKFKDYDLFKQKFERMSIDAISMKEEIELLKEKNHKLDQDFKEARDQLEIYELEAELEARSDEEPSSAEEYRDRYRLIKNAFQKLDLDIQIQKEEYEMKIEKLNGEIVKLRADSKDFMSSDEVKKIITGKDRQIKDLHELVNDFAKTRETTENLFADYRQKQEELEKAKEATNKAMELVKSYQEQVEEFEAITKELEENLNYAELRLCERDNQLKEFEEAKQQLEAKLLKYKQKLVEIEEHKNMLEIKQNTTVESSTIDTNTFSTYYQDYNKVVSQKQILLKERMVLKMKSRTDEIEAMKWGIYIDCIPKTVIAELKIRYFDAYKSVKLNNDKIDIITENLLLHYIYNEALAVESPNLVSMCRDLFGALVHFQQYLNHLRVALIACKTLEQFGELEKSPLYLKVSNGYGRIQDIFDLIKDNELSTQIAFSEISEAAIQLKHTYTDHEIHAEPENLYKYGLAQMFVGLIEKFFDPAIDHDSKNLVTEVSQRLLVIYELILDVVVDEKAASKIHYFSNCAAQSLKEFKIWVDGYSKEIDRNLKTYDQIKQGLLQSIWKKPIEDVKRELEKHEELKSSLTSAEESIKSLESDLIKKSKEIENFNKTKINLEGKILKLQGIANNISTFEYEINELRKIESRQAEEIGDLIAKNKSIEQQLADKNQQLEKRKPFNGKMDTLFTKMTRNPDGRASMSSASNPVIEYNNKNRFEINSLCAILSTTLYQLNTLRTQEMRSKLDRLTQMAPSFANYYNFFSKSQTEAPKINKTIQSLTKNQSTIKTTMSKLRVIDLSSDDKADETIKAYYNTRNKIKETLLDSNNVLLDGLKIDKKNDLPYEIELTKEMKNDLKDRLQTIYGKLSFVGNTSGTKLSEVRGPSLNIDVALA